ncbi:MAG: phenylacetate--CoA ligase family protein [Armatimonadota bacterium]
MAYKISETIPAVQAYQPTIEFMSRGDLEGLHGCLLAQAVRRAKRAPFFRNRLAKIDDSVTFLPTEQFKELVPLTTKQDLRLAGKDAWVEGDSKHIALYLTTSGTTGARITLPYTHEDLHKWYSLAARMLWTNGLRPGDIVLLPVPLGLFSGGHGMFGGLHDLGCTVIPTGPIHTPQMAEVLRGDMGIVPTAIVSLPTHMLRLLDSLPQVGYDTTQSPLRIGSFGAEAWTEAARTRIEEGFGMRAVDSYGIGELCGPGVGAECEYRDGLHIWEDAFLVEVIDPQTGEPVPDGTQGEMVLTNLFREAFPLLRYRTGDAVAIIPERCSCGRTHRRITRILRRLDNVLIITGVNIDPADIETVLYGFPWLANEFYLQVAGSYKDQLVVNVECKAETAVPSNAEEQVIATIRRAYPVRVTVTIHEPGALERTPGKAQRIRG